MSYAIIRTGGKQFRVEPGKTYRFPTMLGDAGTEVTVPFGTTAADPQPGGSANSSLSSVGSSR